MLLNKNRLIDMAHHNTIKYNYYKKLTDRLNLFPQGAVASDLLFEILKIFFSEREAGLVSLLPIKPFNAKKAAAIWKIRELEAERILNDLADKVIIEENCNGCGKSIFVVFPVPVRLLKYSQNV